VRVGADPLLDGAKADLVITDPPYNVAIDGHGSGLGKTRHREFAMASGEMSAAEFTGFLAKAMAISGLNCQTGSLAYYFTDWRHIKEILTAGICVYGEPMNLRVWAKNNGGMGSFYRSAHELIFLFKNGGPHIATTFSSASMAEIALMFGTTPPPIPSLDQAPREICLPSTRHRNQSLLSPMRSRILPHEEL
jgi:hypothetical protein